MLSSAELQGENFCTLKTEEFSKILFICETERLTPRCQNSFSIHSLFVHFLFSIYSAFIQLLFSLHSVFIPYLFSIYSVFIQHLFSFYSAFIQFLFSIYSIFIQHLFGFYSVFITNIILQLHHISPSDFQGSFCSEDELEGTSHYSELFFLLFLCGKPRGEESPQSPPHLLLLAGYQGALEWCKCTWGVQAGG